MNHGHEVVSRPYFSGLWRLMGVAGGLLVALYLAGCAGGTVDDIEGGANQQPANQQPGNQQPGNQQPGNQQPGNQQPANQGGEDVGHGDDTEGPDNQGETDLCEAITCDIGQICNPADGDCVACLSDDNCSAGRYCDTDRFICGDCLVSEHCSDGLYCEASAMECVGCRDNDDCLVGQFCDLPTQTCELIGQCAVDSDCGEDSGVCDSDGWTCVECLGDGDCPDDLICDEQGQTCLECLQDSDCDDGARECVEEFAVCAAPCCDFDMSVVITESGLSFRGFAITVDSQGRAIVGAVNPSDDRIQVVTFDGESWSTEVVSDAISISSGAILDMGIDSEDHPHLVVGSGEDLHYFWRGQQGWNAELLTSIPSGSIYDVTLAMDGQDRAHIIALDVPTLYDISYFWRDSDGTTGEELIDVDHPSVTFRIDVVEGADHQPVAALRLAGSSESFWVLRREGTGDWTATDMGEPSEGNIGIVSDGQGGVWMISRRDQGPVLWSPQGSGWSDALVVTDESATGRVGIGVDELGRVHLFYEAPDEDQVRRLNYLRREGEDWANYDAADWTGVSNSRMAVGQDGHPHIIGYHNGSSELRHASTVP